jgi:hypothetical protein
MTDLHDDDLLKHIENVRGKVLLITGTPNLPFMAYVRWVDAFAFFPGGANGLGKVCVYLQAEFELAAQSCVKATALTFAKHGSVYFRSPNLCFTDFVELLRCRVIIGDLDVQAGEQTVREIENLGR